MNATQEAKLLDNIVNTIDCIGRNICSSNQFEQAYGRAYIKILSQISLYYDNGAFLDEDAEAKYLEKMRGLENLLIECNRNPNPEIKKELADLCSWMNRLLVGPSAKNQCLAFNSILTGKQFCYVFGNNPIWLLKSMYEILVTIFAHAPGEMRNVLVTSFDKYMCNLAIAGQSGVIKYARPNIKPKPLRIPKGDEYYCKSIIDPEFNLTQFLIQGPHSIFYTIDPDIYPIYNVISIFTHRHDMLVAKHSYYFPGAYNYSLEKLHKWNKLNDDQKKENFKLMYPEPVDIIDMFSIPF